MTLVVVKSGNKWDFFIRIYDLKGPNSDRRMIKCINITSSILHNKFIFQDENIECKPNIKI